VNAGVSEHKKPKKLKSKCKCGKGKKCTCKKDKGSLSKKKHISHKKVHHFKAGKVDPNCAEYYDGW
jgi:hypothetical protein